TNFAHDLVLHLNTPDPTPDLPLTADAFQGGLVVEPAPKRRELPLPAVHLGREIPHKQSAKHTSAPVPAHPGDPLTATVQGYWGFDPFTGPTLIIQNTPGKDWHLTGDDLVIAGHDQHLVISSTGTACVDSVTAATSAGKALKAEWKRDSDSGRIEVSLRTADPA